LDLIKLKRASCPDYLDAATVDRLTTEFKMSGKSVWNRNEIKDALLVSSHKKCAYCECKINVESNYLEVEHFEDKDSNPDKVVEWNNLLPSCKRCNGSKGTHDVLTEPIVNPFDVDPKDHLEFKLYRFIDKTTVGRYTIDALNLNHSERAVFRRFEIGEQVLSSVVSAWERYHAWSGGSRSTRSRNLLLGGVEGLLIECQPTSSYSATAATVLHNEPKYLELVDVLRIEGLWSDELEDLHKTSVTLRLDCV
jgi:hypothetical protein